MVWGALRLTFVQASRRSDYNSDASLAFASAIPLSTALSLSLALPLALYLLLFQPTLFPDRSICRSWLPFRLDTCAPPVLTAIEHVVWCRPTAPGRYCTPIRGLESQWPQWPQWTAAELSHYCRRRSIPASWTGDQQKTRYPSGFSLDQAQPARSKAHVEICGAEETAFLVGGAGGTGCKAEVSCV